jgi:choline dehydrogenase-like flavoprotein
VQAVLAQAQHGTHQIGTARMGSTAAEGVVDRNLRVFGSPNLFVASTAVLPTSGQANPTLTAVALALRLAGHLRAECHMNKAATNVSGDVLHERSPTP